VPFSGCVFQLIEGIAAVIESDTYDRISRTCIRDLFDRDGMVKFPRSAKIFHFVLSLILTSEPSGNLS
jgi:hypothetical protein